MEWSVGLHDEFDPEFGELPEAVQDEILALMGLFSVPLWVGRGWIR